MPLSLQLIPGEFAVCRLPASEPVPAWAGSSAFSSITRTANELSIFCPAAQVLAGVKHEAGWRLLKFQGPFAFSETGILAVSTFDTDYVLVKAERLDAALATLAAAGYTVRHALGSPGANGNN